MFQKIFISLVIQVFDRFFAFFGFSLYLLMKRKNAQVDKFFSSCWLEQNRVFRLGLGGPFDYLNEDETNLNWFESIVHVTIADHFHKQHEKWIILVV